MSYSMANITRREIPSMMKKLFFLLILFVAFFCSCGAQKRLSNHQYATLYLLPDSLLIEWRKDKNGCLNLRCKYGDTLRQNTFLIGISKADFLMLFGKPDSMSAQRDILLYYICAECDNKKNIASGTDSVIFFASCKTVSVSQNLQGNYYKKGKTISTT
jgi:hypothetical protein